MEPLPQDAIAQHIDDRGDGHALMVGHEAAHDRQGFAVGQAGGGEIDSLVKAVTPFGPKFCQMRVVLDRSAGVDHRGKSGGIGRNHPVLA